MNNIQVSLVAALTTDSDFFVAALYEADNLAVCLESQQVPKTGGVYITPFQVTFAYNVIIGTTYRVILWESVDATPSGANKSSGDITVLVNGVNTRNPIYLTAGTSAGMAIGDTTYVDPTSSLEGWSYTWEQLGYGTLTPGAGQDYTTDPTTNNPTLINGTTFADGQKFVIKFEPQIGQAVQPPSGNISSGLIITADVAMDASYKNKALFLQGAGTNLSLDLPPLTAMTSFVDQMVFYSSGGSHISAIIDTNGTDKILLLGTLVSEIVLIQGGWLKLFKANGVWNIDDVDPRIYMRGEVVWKWSPGDPGIFPLNGTLLGRKDYQGLFTYAQTKGTIVSEGIWANTATKDGRTYFPNKANYTMGTSSSNFRVPVLYGNFVRAADGVTWISGATMWDTQLDHQHATQTGLIPGAPYGEGPAAASNGRYFNQQNQPSDLSGPSYRLTAAGAAGVQLQRVAVEVAPMHISLYAGVRF